MKRLQDFIHDKADAVYHGRPELIEAFMRGAVWATANKINSTPPKDPDSEQLFDQWWNLYDKKRGRKKALQKWNRLSADQHQDILAATPAYVSSISDRQYQKDPITYLNGECWKDEIITENGERQQNIRRAQKAARILLGTDH